MATKDGKAKDEKAGGTYKVLAPINHNGRDYQPGDELSGLTDEQAAALLAVGAIEG